MFCTALLTVLISQFPCFRILNSGARKKKCKYSIVLSKLVKPFFNFSIIELFGEFNEI